MKHINDSNGKRIKDIKEACYGNNSYYVVKYTDNTISTQQTATKQIKQFMELNQ
jgi:hypothetical protein